MSISCFVIWNIVFVIPAPNTKILCQQSGNIIYVRQYSFLSKKLKTIQFHKKYTLWYVIICQIFLSNYKSRKEKKYEISIKQIYTLNPSADNNHCAKTFFENTNKSTLNTFWMLVSILISIIAYHLDKNPIIISLANVM